jgi:hypothetical protein
MKGALGILLFLVCSWNPLHAGAIPVENVPGTVMVPRLEDMFGKWVQPHPLQIKKAQFEVMVEFRRDGFFVWKETELLTRTSFCQHTRFEENGSQFVRWNFPNGLHGWTMMPMSVTIQHGQLILIGADRTELRFIRQK